MSKRRGFGHTRKLPSKRWQASYIGPDLIRHNAPVTFAAEIDAEGWLAKRRAEILGEEWTPPTPRAAPVTFAQHAERWLIHRKPKPRTREHYRWLLDRYLLPTFGPVALKPISADLVDGWHLSHGEGSPTATAHAYGLLRTILKDAVERRLIPYNPCLIRGAGNALSSALLGPDQGRPRSFKSLLPSPVQVSGCQPSRPR